MFKKIFKEYSRHKLEYIFLLITLIFAAFLRLYRIADYMTFLGDEGRDVLVVKRMIVDHKFTLLGPTASVGGFFLGPVYYYFMLPFLWAFRLNPVGPAVMVALFGVATVFLVYQTGKNFFDPKAGLIAAVLYSISPVVIAYNRSSWNPNLMPFFCLLIIWLTRKSVIDKNPKILPLVGFFFGIAIQLHYLTVFLMVIIALYIILFSRRLSYLKYYLLSVFGFLAGFSPFFLFELRHNFPNFQTIYRFIFFGKDTGLVSQKFFPIATDIVFRLFHRLVTNNQTFLSYTTLLVSLTALFYFWLKTKKSRRYFLTFSLLGLWLILGVGLFGFYKKEIYDYYFGFMFPLPFLLTSLSLNKVAKINRFFSWLSGLTLVLLFWVNIKGMPFRYPPNKQMEQTKKIAQFVLEKTEGKPYNFALITGGNSDHAYRYFLEIWGHPPVTILNPQIDPERKSVTDQLLVICETACSPEGHPLWEVAGFGRAKIEGQWDIPFVKIFKLRHWHEQDEGKDDKLIKND